MPNLDWTGLDWTGLDWTGLDWTGLDWTGLDWTGLDWTGLDYSGTTTPDTSLSNADCRLASASDSTFESALIGGIRPTVDVNFSTHLPTAVGRLSLRRLVGRCVVKIVGVSLA